MKWSARTQKKAKTAELNSITEGVIWKQLLLFFFPILFGTFFQQLYNTADAIIVGRFVGKSALAAVGGSTAILVNLLVGFFVGLSSGATVIISQFYGAKHEERVSDAVHTALAFAIVCGFIMMIFGFTCSEAVLRMMGTPKDIMEDSLTYIHIFFGGIIFNLIYNMGAGILRAVGDSKRPLYFLIASCATNIVLDIILVVFLQMGVRGAAYATITSQMVSAVLVIAVLLRTNECYRLEWKKLKLSPHIVVRIVQIGFPAGLQSVMYSGSNMILQSSINALGTNTVAAWTAYSKIDSVFWMIISALGISITTFVGQNYGAGKIDRVKRGVYVCLGIAALITVSMSTILYFFGSYIFYLFTMDSLVFMLGTRVLKYLVPTFICYICIEVFSGALRGIGDCWIPMMMTALGVCALRVVWILLVVPLRHNIITVVSCYPLTWSVTSILFLIYYHWFSQLRRFQPPFLKSGKRKKKEEKN